jgi:hypothetical protein
VGRLAPPPAFDVSDQPAPSGLSVPNNSRSAPAGGWSCQAARALRRPAATQRQVNTDQRRRRVGLRLRELVAVAQHFAFSVQHDQKISHARVETQARQLRCFLRAGGGGQQAFGALSFRPAPDECTRGDWSCCICYVIDSCLRLSLMGCRLI